MEQPPPTGEAAPNGSTASGHCGMAFLDTVTVELTTGTDLVARPYRHSVSGRHILLSQSGGTLWKATRSVREKKFYATIIAAATGHWDWLEAEEARSSQQQPDAGGLEQEKETIVGALRSSPTSSSQGRVPISAHKVYADAANALAPFLPRYYGTRKVASLKVGSIGFSEEDDASLLSPGEYDVTPRRRGDPPAAAAHALASESGAGQPGSRDTSPSQSVLSSQMPQNASRVVISTDAVAQVLRQFASDKRAIVAAEEESAANGGNQKVWGDGAVISSVATVLVPTEAEAEAEGEASGKAPSPLRSTSTGACEDVVAAATAQIAEELSRRLPPRHPDSSSLTGSSSREQIASMADASLRDPRHPHQDTSRVASQSPDSPANTAPSPSVNAAAGGGGGTETDGNGNTAGLGEGSVEMIVLQDMCYGFEYPCVMDVKMGTRQYGMNAKPEKLREKVHKAEISTSKQFGIRLAGFKRWSATHQSYEVKTKHDLFTLNWAEVTAMLHYFLSSYQPPRRQRQEGEQGDGGAEEGPGRDVEDGGKEEEEEAAAKKAERVAAVRRKLLGQLTQLLEAFKAHGVFRFYTSSLLIVYDAADPVSTCRAVMVDFAYTYEWGELVKDGDPDAALAVDEGYIRGIDSLIQALREPV